MFFPVYIIGDSIDIIEMSKALLIGINYIGSPAELRGCINDVLNVRKLLLEIGFDDSNVAVMTEAADNADKIPTTANIVTGLQWLCANATKDSDLFLHYSGHGTTITDSGNDEEDRKDEAICPVDNGYISDDYLRGLISGLPSGCRFTAIMDCCHSGTIFDLKYVCGGNIGAKNNDLGRLNSCLLNINNNVETAADVMVLSGCKDNQYSMDATIEGKSQGALTYSFLQVVRKRVANSSNNLSIPCPQFITEVDNAIKHGKYEQIPQLSCGRSSNLALDFAPKRQKRE
jgi:metacaspase-1